jgi:hypothetical protein
VSCNTRRFCLTLREVARKCVDMRIVGGKPVCFLIGIVSVMTRRGKVAGDAWKAWAKLEEVPGES